jgi:hypothetical protein
MLWLVRSAIVMLYPRTQLPGMVDCNPAQHVARFKKESPGIVWLGTVAGALVFHLTPLLTVFVPLPAGLLPARLLDLHASRIAGTGIYLLRQAIFLLKVCAGLCWGADPKVRQAFALPPMPPDPGTWRKA